MDLLHKFLNIAVPLLMLIAFPFFMPPFLLLKFLSFLKRSIYSEKVSGKVVLNYSFLEYLQKLARFLSMSRHLIFVDFLHGLFILYNLSSLTVSFDMEFVMIIIFYFKGLIIIILFISVRIVVDIVREREEKENWKKK